MTPSEETRRGLTVRSAGERVAWGHRPSGSALLGTPLRVILAQRHPGVTFVLLVLLLKRLWLGPTQSLKSP